MLFLVLPSVRRLFRQKSFQRNLQQKPKVSVSSVVKGSYQKKYEKYLSDQFFLRDKWVNIYAQLEKNTCKKEINNVYIGKDDYLIEKYSERDFDDELQKMNVKNLALFLDAYLYVCSVKD